VTVTALCPGPTESGFAFASSGEDSNLFKGKKLPTAKDVAEFGYEALMRGKIVAVPGFKNNLLVSAVRFTPRYMVTSIVRNMNKNAKL
jgi:short-subunit dehydrogenase